MLPPWLCCCEPTFCSPSCFGSYLCRWPLPLLNLGIASVIYLSASKFGHPRANGRRNAECSPRRQTRTKRYSMNYDTPSASEDSRQEILIPRQDKISTSREHMRGFKSRRQIRKSLSLRSGFCDPLNLTPFFAGLVTRARLSRI